MSDDYAAESTADMDSRINFDAAHMPIELIGDDGEQVQLDPARLPRLLGWTVLLQPWIAPKQTRGGVFLPDTVADANEYLTYVFRVVALGPLAFAHPRLRGGVRTGKRIEREEVGADVLGSVTHWTEHEEAEFAAGVEPPEPGDWVIVQRFSGIALEVDGVPLRLANDDNILAVIDSPKGWKAYVAT